MPLVPNINFMRLFQTDNFTKSKQINKIELNTQILTRRTRARMARAPGGIIGAECRPSLTKFWWWSRHWVGVWMEEQWWTVWVLFYILIGLHTDISIESIRSWSKRGNWLRRWRRVCGVSGDRWTLTGSCVHVHSWSYMMEEQGAHIRRTRSESRIREELEADLLSISFSFWCKRTLVLLEFGIRKEGELG